MSYIRNDPIKDELKSNFLLATKIAPNALGYTHSFGECFHEDNSTDPGGGYTPTTTTASIDVDNLNLVSGTTGAGATTYYWTAEIIPTAAYGNALLLMEYSLNGGTVVVELLENDNIGAPVWKTLINNTNVVTTAARTSYRILITITNSAGGVTPEIKNFVIITK